MSREVIKGIILAFSFFLCVGLLAEMDENAIESICVSFSAIAIIVYANIKMLTQDKEKEK